MNVEKNILGYVMTITTEEALTLTAFWVGVMVVALLYAFYWVRKFDKEFKKK